MTSPQDDIENLVKNNKDKTYTMKQFVEILGYSDGVIRKAIMQLTWCQILIRYMAEGKVSQQFIWNEDYKVDE